MRVSEDSKTELDEETFAAPPPRQVIKLSDEVRIDGSRVWWRGRLRGGGADVLLESAWRCARTLGGADRTRVQSCLLSRRMLGSLYRRFFRRALPTCAPRTASRALCTSSATGAAMIAACARAALTVRCRARIFCACCWRAGQPAIARAAARRTTRQPPVWCSRPPPAARHTRCAGRGPVDRIYATMPLCHYVATLLRRYAAMPLRHYATMRGA